MLAVPPLRSTKDEIQGEMESFSVGEDDFADLSERNLLESINFDDLFVDINDGDVLPDLEMDSEILAEFSGGGGCELSEMASLEKEVENNLTTKKEDDKASSINSGPGSGLGSNSGLNREHQEIVSKRDESTAVNQSPKQVEKRRKSSSAQPKNNSQGKKKVKVDWTPDLHRRFVQAVEQLGLDKAVPSRILEIMGIDCLTRHNIASHLQKYRSHRKHLLAREAEAASWSQRREIYDVPAACGGGGGHGGKRDISPWLAPTMGFPPITPIHHFRALHVWGHPSTDQPFTHMYPLSPPPLAWAAPLAPPPHPPPAADSYWHIYHQRGHNALTPGTPCFPQPLTTTKFASPSLVPGIPPPTQTMYKVDPGIGVANGQSSPSPLFDFHPSKESIDEAVGDFLSKPWQPLPLGLRAPALDSVMAELQRQGVSKVPPSCEAEAKP